MHRPNQDGLGRSSGLAHYIDTEVAAVDEVDISIAARSEHHSVSGRESGSAVTGRITDKVCLGFHDDGCSLPLLSVPYEKMS